MLLALCKSQPNIMNPDTWPEQYTAWVVSLLRTDCWQYLEEKDWGESGKLHWRSSIILSILTIMSHWCGLCVCHLLAIIKTFRLVWFPFQATANLSSDSDYVSVMDWTDWNTRMKTNDKCLLQKQFSVYCISDQHVCMTHRLWQQPHRHTVTSGS